MLNQNSLKKDDFDKIAKDTVIDESENKNDGKNIKAKVAAGKGKYGDGMEFKGAIVLFKLRIQNPIHFSLGQLE